MSDSKRDWISFACSAVTGTCMSLIEVTSRQACSSAPRRATASWMRPTALDTASWWKASSASLPSSPVLSSTRTEVIWVVACHHRSRRVPRSTASSTKPCCASCRRW